MSNARLLCASDVHAIPDGTIITWYRIPGDETSEAVAFVRQAYEYSGIREDEEAGIRSQEQVTWISPGGWDPMTIESAGITYPAKVLRWGNLLKDIEPDWSFAEQSAAGETEIPVPPEFQRLTVMPEGWPTIHGGTWAREKALECAASVYRGGGHNVSGGHVTSLAAEFETWLDREPAASPHLGNDPRDLLDACTREDVLLADRLMAAREAIIEAHEFNNLTGVSAAFLDRMNAKAQQLYDRAGFTP